MPRSLALGNGNMLVTLDNQGLMCDFYFPYVGMEDHTTFRHHHRIGIFEEGSQLFSWLSDDHWKSERKYQKETMVGETTLSSDKWNIEIKFEDFVHPIENVFCRKIHVTNLLAEDRRFRMFFNFDFHLYGVKGNDTAYYDPKNNSIIFYKYNRYFLANGQTEHGGIDQYATGKSEYQDLVGTWKDSEDGQLSGHPIEQGSVDATFALHFEAKANKESILDIWIAAGEKHKEVEAINKNVKTNGINELLNYTRNYWNSWVNKAEIDFSNIPKEFEKLFKQSLLIIRTQVDNHGAIIAANDTDIMKFNKDSYSYMWARDAALIAMTLDNVGYIEITRRFFNFCNKVQSKEGFLLHKFNPDGSLGSSWHPWISNGDFEVPLQEDETALPIIAIYNHYKKVKDIEFIQDIFDQFVLNAAHFLSQFIDDETGLPKECYDPWEEQKGVFTFTCSTVYGGLISASELAHIVGHNEYRDFFKEKAEIVKKAILEYLWDEENQTFVKKITYDKNGKMHKDTTADASITGIFKFGVLAPNDPQVVSTMKYLKDKLEIKTGTGGWARYENDYYHAVTPGSNEVPGNPWIITTLWYAQWLLLITENEESQEFKEAEDILKWVVDKADTTSILPEQINPFNSDPLSVAPLTWSHATFVDTVLLYHAIKNRTKNQD